MTPGPEANRSRSRHRSVDRQIKEENEWEGNQWNRDRSAKRGSRSGSVASGRPNTLYEESKGGGKEKGGKEGERTNEKGKSNPTQDTSSVQKAKR